MCHCCPTRCPQATAAMSGKMFFVSEEGHLNRDCRSSNRCQVCRGCHHPSICGSLASGLSHQPAHQSPSRMATSISPAEAPTTTASGVAATTQLALNPSSPTFNLPPTSPALCVDSNRTVLLQTALAEVSNPRDPTSVMRVRFVMDSGSQKSYLTQWVKDCLPLPVIYKQCLLIAAFGSSKRGLKSVKLFVLPLGPSLESIRCSNSSLFHTSVTSSL